MDESPVVTGDKYLSNLVNFVHTNASSLLDNTLVLKLNPVGLHYVHSRLDTLHELERLIPAAPVDYLRAYVSDLGDHRALEQLRRILCRVTMLKIVSVLPPPGRDPTPVSLRPFARLKVLELRGCDLSSSVAKGLLELRGSLEKLVCHNSTDALRHVFSSRIANIKESPQWSRLSFVSCACNGLILMDESLQLLPAVETLDLSRNKFAKVDNLRKCTRLSHLDLGFNQLRSVASFGEVLCNITKLVLRSNALTSLRGIEALKSLEGLDASYNIISSYYEIEVLASFPSLRNIWLEGNPLCCARWYRPQVFSFFAHPEQVRLDDKEMSTRDFWKRQIVVARRQRKPASYGFYSPAREDNEGEGLIDGKRKKLSRLACIESEERGMNMSLEQDSLSCENEIQGVGENVVSDNEGEISSLINRIECMKKERSKLWLEDIKDWMDQGSENGVSEIKNYQAVLAFDKSDLVDTTKSRYIGESSRYSGYVSDSNMLSGDDESTNALESNSSFAGSSVCNRGHQWLDSVTGNGETKPGTIETVLEEDNLKSNFLKGEKCGQMTDYNFATASLNVHHDHKMNVSSTPVTSINSFKESMSSAAPPTSPPHYQEDILYRRYYLEEEFLQLSAESFSVASPDSDTSCDDDDRFEDRPPSPKTERFVGKDILPEELHREHSPLLVVEDETRHYVPDIGLEESGSLSLCAQQMIEKFDEHDSCLEKSHDDVPPVGSNCEDYTTYGRQDAEFSEKKNARRKPKKRVVSLSEENSIYFCEDTKDEHKMRTVTD